MLHNAEREYDEVRRFCTYIYIYTYTHIHSLHRHSPNRIFNTSLVLLRLLLMLVLLHIFLFILFYIYRYTVHSKNIVAASKFIYLITLIVIFVHWPCHVVFFYGIKLFENKIHTGNIIQLQS